MITFRELVETYMQAHKAPRAIAVEATHLYLERFHDQKIKWEDRDSFVEKMVEKLEKDHEAGKDLNVQQ